MLRKCVHIVDRELSSKQIGQSVYGVHDISNVQTETFLASMEEAILQFEIVTNENVTKTSLYLRLETMVYNV